MPPPRPALLLGRCTAHCCTAAGVTRRTHPGWPMRGFRPASWSLLGAELRVPTKTPIRALPGSFAGEMPSCGCRVGVPHGLVLGWPVAASPTPLQCPPPPNHDDSLLVKADFPSSRSVSQPRIGTSSRRCPFIGVSGCELRCGAVCPAGMST